MNIVYLIHEFPERGASGCGAGNYVFNIARIMVKHGHNVKVVVESEREEIKIEYGIEVHRIRATKGFHNTGKPMKTSQKFLKNVWRSIWYNAEVVKINKKEHIDIIQCVDCYSISFFRCTDIPYVVRFSDYYALWVGAAQPVYDREYWVNSKRADLVFWKWAYERADALIAPSNLVKDLIEGESKKKVTIVESPICIDDFQEICYDQYNVNTNQYWVTYCLMRYRKSIPILSEIIDDLLDAYPQMKYIMIGKDEKILYKDTIMNVSDMFKMNIKKHYDRFIFTGKITNHNLLFSIVKNSYACILPSRVDNLPNSILEAMAFGKIVVSSDKTSAEQLITDGYSGFLAKIDDKEDLFQKIKCVMQLSDDEKKQMEKRAKERVKDLTSEKVYENMIKVYKETITKFRKKHS